MNPILKCSLSMAIMVVEKKKLKQVTRVKPRIFLHAKTPKSVAEIFSMLELGRDAIIVSNCSVIPS